MNKNEKLNENNKKEINYEKMQKQKLLEFRMNRKDIVLMK